MDYTEQFIRLNCSLMSDYKMMKLNAEMKCMGIGLYIQMILFLRRQQEYKHDFNELDLLAEQWGATVEDLQHLIKDFNLFVIMEDGYFRCLYLDEVMGYQNKLSEQRAAAGSKGGRSSKKKTVQTAEKVITSTVLTAADKEANDDAGNKENNTESSAENSVKCMKNTIEKSDDENVTENTLQCIDNECVNGGLQASFKQSFIREEKNRGEKKKKDDVDIIETNGSIDDDMKFCSGKKSGEMLRWECYINEAFKVQSWVEIVGMMSGLKGDFLNNLPFIRSMFKKHVVVQGSTERITSVSEAQAYFANYIRPGKPTRLFLEEKLKERSRMQNESTSLSPYETYNPLTGERSYCGVPLPADAPPRPNGRATWDNLKQSWI